MKTYIGTLGKWIAKREAKRLASLATFRGIKAEAKGEVVDFGVEGWRREYSTGEDRSPFLFGLLAEMRRRA